MSTPDTLSRPPATDSFSNLADIARRWAAHDADRTALHYGGRAISYGELDRRSSQVANALRASGVEAGDRIAFLDMNGPEYFEVTLGAAKLNAVTVALNWRLAPQELAYIVDDAEAKVLIASADFADAVAALRPQLDRLEETVIVGEADGGVAYEEWLGAQSETDPMVPTGPDDAAMQIYTSGTTGLPKGAMLTNRNFFSMLEKVGSQWRFTPDSVSLVVMPLFHFAGSGWALVGMCHGCSAVLLREAAPPAILNAISAHRVTNALLVPALLQILLKTPGVQETDFSSLHSTFYGASPISDKVLVESMKTLRCDFIQLYGMTETTGAITVLDSEDHDPEGRPHLLRSCGKPYPGIEIRVVEPATGEPLPPGSVGEIWTRSEQNMAGYWKRPDETSAAITSDGWLKTGDAGYFDDAGYLYLTDRVKDMIVSGGENIYPAEVENVLMQLDGVADVAVIGVPDEKWGETVKAVVVRDEGASVDEPDVIAFARERLAHFKCPSSVDFADALPRNPSGKLLKRELREPYWRGHDRRIN